MNLFVINQFASTPKYTTGAGERFYYLARELKKYGINTTVVAGSFNHLQVEQPSSENLLNYEIVDGQDYIWVRLRKYSAKSMLGRVISLFEFLLKLFFISPKKIRNQDVILVSSMSIFPIFFAVYVKSFFKIPIILEIRDIWPLTPIEIGGYSKYHPFMKLIEWSSNLAYKISDYIVSVLPSFDNFLKDNGFQNFKFKWIPNGINMEAHESENKKRSSGKFIIAYTGAIGQANALEYLVNAANLINKEDEIEVWILGEGPEKDNLKELIKDESKVKFFPKVKKGDVQSFLSKVDCCYIGWRNKSVYSYGVSANKYNDYMLSQKPILVSTNNENDPVALANSGIVVDAEDPESIYAGIKEMYNLSEKERKAFGENGFNFVKNNKNYTILGKEYSQIIKSLINE